MHEPSGADKPVREGWGVSLRFQGRTVADRRVPADRPVVVGEDPACTLVVPGLGAAATLARGDAVCAVDGLTGTVERAGTTAPFAAGPVAPGDRVALRIAAHPEIELELRRERFERLPLGTLINVRELARQLTIGAALVGAVALLARIETPVNALEIQGEPDADEDSALVRAMYVAALEAPVVELRTHELFVVPPPPPPPPPAAAMPIAAVGPEEAPVPLAEVDLPAPETPRPRLGGPGSGAVDPSEYGILGMLQADDAELGAVLGGVEGGVKEGALGGVAIAELLARSEPGAPALGVEGRRGFGHAGAVEVPVDRIESPEPVDLVMGEVLEDVMGPSGGHDVAVVEATGVKPEIAELPPPPPSGGLNSHTADGADATRGVAHGLAAVAPDAKCDDPSRPRKPQLDVVFVVDVSTTMTFMLDRIEKQIAQVDAEARAQALDPRYGLVVFVDDVEVANGGQPYADIAALQRDLAIWQAFTASNRQVKSTAANLDWPENSLDALHAAATQFAWRPADTTLRMVVHATDDDFGEAPAVQSGQPVRHGYRETVRALRAAEVRMFSFAAKVGGQCECLDVRHGLFTDFRGQKSLPTQTGGAVFDIDEVASGRLGFAAAVGGAIRSGVCTSYPLAPFARPKPPTGGVVGGVVGGVPGGVEGGVVGGVVGGVPGGVVGGVVGGVPGGVVGGVVGGVPDGVPDGAVR